MLRRLRKLLLHLRRSKLLHANSEQRGAGWQGSDLRLRHLWEGRRHRAYGRRHCSRLRWRQLPSV